ncbi:MAG: T9SS type A sorting domain-containing protein [Melioribacteraceae bacterium]|nr:T9SS type A sorting domain-containing protein [Melioribacteraceae bacterium]
MKQKYIILFLLLTSNLIPAQSISELNNDKARYNPGDDVITTVEFDGNVSGYTLTAKFHFFLSIKDTLNYELINSDNLNINWKAPQADYRGYLMEVQLRNPDDSVVSAKSIGIDVSSDWAKFPRYGFLSSYGNLNPTSMEYFVNNLKRFHINGIQFYDYHWKHHLPLKGTVENPSATWNDLANRTIYFNTVKGYIDLAHSFNMKAMAYNLLFGSFDDAPSDGVPTDWRLFNDAAASIPAIHDLPDNWVSDIFLMDISNSLWNAHIIHEMKNSISALGFDGWHVDQLGDLGSKYNSENRRIILRDYYRPFLEAAKDSSIGNLVMNAVNQYGQSQIADSPVDFLYTEVWSPNHGYRDLATIILTNNFYGDNKLNTVLAAYVNYGKSSGTFNTPSVLFADAVIFASGGAHLELGEHMLSHEYFPSSKLAMSKTLQSALINYYDFSVAYQNLLRDNVETNDYTLESDTTILFTDWPPAQGQVWAFPRKKDNRYIFHLINFVDAPTMDWVDDNAAQITPSLIQNIPVHTEIDEQATKVWIASPDFLEAVPVEVPFEQNGKTVSFSVPDLKYWTMVVIETDAPNSAESDEEIGNNFKLYQNYPNPFNPNTTIRYSLKESSNVKIKVFDSIGTLVDTLVDDVKAPGEYSVKFNASALASGVYFYQFYTASFIQIKKMMVLK